MFHGLAQVTSDFTTTTTTTTSDGGGSALLVFVISIVFYLIFAFILSVIFKKAGRKAWEAYVPIYNTWVTLEIAGKPGWWVLINLVPFIGGVIFFVLYIIATIELAKRFGKGPFFAIFGLILFSLIGMLILAFGKSTYSGPGAVAIANGAPSPTPFGGTPTPDTVSPVTPSTPPANDTVVAATPSPVDSPIQSVDEPSSPAAPTPQPAPQPPVSAVPVQPEEENNTQPPANPTV